MSSGKYIVIEGLANHRGEVLQELYRQLSAAQLAVKIFREPESQNDLTARAINRLTHDARYPMTSETEVLLYNAARVQSLGVIRHALENGVICLVDRNYLTTLAVQYYGYGDLTDYQRVNEIIEFATAGLQPDLTVVLDTPVAELDKAVSSKFLIGRGHMDSTAFLERIRAGYLWEAQQRGMPVVHATQDRDATFKEVWTHVSAALAMRDKSTSKGVESVGDVIASAVEPPFTQAVAPQQSKASTVEDSEPQPWLQKNDNGSMSVTDAGRAELAKYVTNTGDSVYSFTDQISPITVAAAMARLSRRGDDMRVTMLDEFIGKVEKDAQLLQRVITAYGDDSVQQLTGQYMVVENASNLLTKKLEWGRLAAYLEQSTRYIYFDQKDAEGHYRYFVPENLRGKLRSQYIRTMNQIFDVYSKLVADLTTHIRTISSTPKKEQDAAWRSATKAQACDAIRPVLPVATKSTVGIYASGQALESLIMHLLSDELPEARTVGQQMLDEARKTDAAVFLERADKPERGGATIAYRANTYTAVQSLAKQLLPSQYAAENEPVTLTGYMPHNELDVVADILYEHSDLPLEELRQTVSSWSYQRKADVLTAYFGERLNRRHRPGRALETVHYSFDLVCDYGIFRDLQRHRMVDDMEWQFLSPRMGYDTPKLVEEAGLADLYDQCFDLSLQLYSALQGGGYPLEAQYATLLGHKMRWKFTMNAREAFHFIELRTSPQGHPGYRKLTQQMYEKITEVHPLTAAGMKFVNQGEDPELARLAAEKYTQYKLEQLDSSPKRA